VTIGTGPDNLVRKVQLFKELLPGMTQVAYLQDKSEIQSWIDQVIQTVDRVLSVKFLPFGATIPTDYADAFAVFPRERIDGLIVGGGGITFGNRQLILELAAKYRLPAMYNIRDYAAAGGLIADASDLVVLYRHLAGYVDLILKGAKPADLPVGARPSMY
jgi:putative ABC transport system substrate-binding protein